MALAAGTRIGPYQVVDVLGAGGMGEVYRAHDARLSRDVALKILSTGSEDDPERHARFQREAQVLAQVRHANIGAIYGLEEGQGGDGRTIAALVLELVEGETLADRLARGPLPIDEAREIVRQIADALEAAHERGIIHRDLKPANIKIAPDGVVKVLDFGLAKLTDGTAAVARGVSAPSSGPHQARPTNISMSPTVVSPAHVTGVGIILGTAAYMAPEQAKGKPADKRSDIWSFGCVLYEMLAGTRPFAGTDVSEVLAAVIRGDVNWSALPTDTPVSIRRLLRRCLERDPKRRLHDIADARLELHEEDLAPLAMGRPPRRRYVVPVAVAVTIAAAVAGALAWTLKPIPPGPLRKLDVSADLTAGIPPDNTSSYHAPVRLSPDGMRAAYIARGHLWIRELDRTTPRDLGQLPEGSYTITWSPDSAYIGFAAPDRKFRKIAVSGGPPVVICTLPATGRITSAAWPADDTIVFAAWRESLYKVSAAGGTPELWLKVDPAKEVDFHSPEPLPGRRVMFRTHTRGTGADEVSVLEMYDGTTRSLLLRENGLGHVAYAAPGFLLFVRASGGLWAAPFEVPIDMSKAFLIEARASGVSASRDGTLLISSPVAGSETMQLVRVDRKGTVLGEVVPAATGVSEPLFSPDGRKLAFHSHAGGNPDVWVLDVERNTTTRLSFEPGEDTATSWFGPDTIVYTRHGDEIEGTEVAAMAADGSGSLRGLVKGLGATVSPDGKYVVFLVDERGFIRVRYAERHDDGTIGEPRRLVQSDPEPALVYSVSLSPDGHLLAYHERGADDERGVFITRFPSGEGRWQVAPTVPTLSSVSVRWNRNAKELFFIGRGKTDDTVQMMAMPVTGESTVTFGRPVPLFSIDTASAGAGFDVAPDGQTFVIGRDRTTGDSGLRTKFTLVENWSRELRTVAP